MNKSNYINSNSDNGHCIKDETMCVGSLLEDKTSGETRNKYH